MSLGHGETLLNRCYRLFQLRGFANTNPNTTLFCRVVESDLSRRANSSKSTAPVDSPFLANTDFKRFSSQIERFDPVCVAPSDTGSVAALLATSQESGPKLILWDLVSSCNLKCPSCPMGSMRNADSKGLISDDVFDRVLAKLAREFPGWQLHFYNWTEPLIHPRINHYCKTAADTGFHVHLSSNLNHLKDTEGLMAAGMKTFRISLSGFTQPVYERGHRGGKIERVKQNMIRLSEAKKAVGSRTRIHVYYHKYRYNLDELPLMENFARSLGFDFLADWAFLMPLEKLIQYVEGDVDAFALDSIVPSVDDAVALMQPHRAKPCELIDQLVLDYCGNVQLCCSVFDSVRNTIGNYLETDWAELQTAKYQHTTCVKCMHYAAHVLYTNVSHPELREQMAQLAKRQSEEPRDQRRSASIPLTILSGAA